VLISFIVISLHCAEFQRTLLL